VTQPAAKPETKETCYDGVHCRLTLQRHGNGVVILRIEGTDVGEFGSAPMQTLDEWLDGTRPYDLYIDAREVRGASIHVSGEWSTWLSARRERLRSVTMLTGSRFIEVTAEFVRRFAGLQGLMRICTEPAVFDQALRVALQEPRSTNPARPFDNDFCGG
jgi:hypothetical protein